MDRVRELDGIRGVAILLVLVWHYVNRQIEPSNVGLLPYLKLATNVTWSGVDLFFVLSGFLIGGILFDHRSSANYFRVFYIRRACRILPLYFVIIGVFLVLSQRVSRDFDWLFAGALPAWTYVTFTQNYYLHSFVGAAHWLDLTWSLAVEEQFYLGLPLLIRFVAAPLIVPSLIFLILLGPIMRFWVGGLGAYVYAFCRTDALLLGVLLAWLFRQPKFVQFVRSKRLLGWSVLSALILLTSFIPLIAFAFGGVGNHFWFAILYGLFLLLVVVFPESHLAGILRNPILVWLGIRSYCIYLTHQAVSGLLHGAIFSAEPRIDGGYQFIVTVAATLAVWLLASLSFRYFELPLLSFGRRFSYHDGHPSVDKQCATDSRSITF